MPGPSSGSSSSTSAPCTGGSAPSAKPTTCPPARPPVAGTATQALWDTGRPRRSSAPRRSWRACPLRPRSGRAAWPDRQTLRRSSRRGCCGGRRPTAACPEGGTATSLGGDLLCLASGLPRAFGPPARTYLQRNFRRLQRVCGGAAAQRPRWRGLGIPDAIRRLQRAGV